MATTNERDLYIRGERPGMEATSLAATTTVLAGTFAMNDAGAVKPAATGVAGSLLLGMAAQTYANPAGQALIIDSPPMTFRRGFVRVNGKAGALPTQANVGKKVRIVDNDSVSNEVIGANDLSVTLVAIDADGLGFWVEV